ncbi:LOW QUALITY PROTEIN: gasdermin-C-like [Hippopotamus amphibius kiboko]|uniref:LOW QUALITY PROTEIN: gasdermin-C-like n=1 Tax=Hippopotamus amphibius kiboko TaxID=575201 RepID=UPI002592393D|nr:LOW QUALITY PROTEIN: gasdermin-C-like [Hippopotamus amphibius kiboko]
MGIVHLPTLKGTGEGAGLRVRNKTWTLPQGTVMACKRKQLVFKRNGGVSKPERGRAEVGNQRQKTSLPIEGGEEQDFSATSKPARLKRYHRDIQRQSPAWRGTKGAPNTGRPQHWAKCSPNPDHLNSFKLDWDSLDPLDSFGGTFLSEMKQDSRNLWLDSRFHIVYLLEAILVLSDTQHELLAWSMEKSILQQEWQLVKSILEPNFRYPCNLTFTLDPRFLAPLQGEVVALTFGLLEECGLRVAPDKPQGTWDLEANKPLSALYGSLSVLQQLAEA